MRLESLSRWRRGRLNKNEEVMEMIWKGKSTLFYCSIALMTIFLVSCNSSEKQGEANPLSPETSETNETNKTNETNETNNDPVTLDFYLRTQLLDHEFEAYINRFVQKKFPHVTLNVSRASTPGNKIEDVIASNNMPDFIWDGITRLGQLTELNVPQDLTPLAKKHGFSFEAYEPKVMESIQAYADQDQIYYLPLNIFVFALHYNKDLFDKFAIQHPQDGMFWEDVIELGRRMTREEDGVLYQGIHVGSWNRLSTQMSLGFADPIAKTSLLQSDGWRKYFELHKLAYHIPGQPEVQTLGGGTGKFLNERTLAMFADIFLLQNEDMEQAEREGLNWDVVSYPTLKDNPGVGVGVFSDGFIIPVGSQHPDLAFQIISYLSSDREVQLEITKSGRPTGLNDADIRRHAFASHPAAAGKNLENLFINRYPDPYVITPYDNKGSDIMRAKLLEYVQGLSEINTLLRVAAEEHNQAIAEWNAAQ